MRVSLLKKKKYPVVVPENQHSMTTFDVEREVLGVLNHLRRKGYEAYLVGGCIRDILLKKTAKDYDIVTDARPNQIKRIFRRCYLIGKRFRLAHVYIDRQRFVEVATFRGIVDPQDFDEDSYAANNVFGTMKDDVLRRDFTVNALYYNSADGSIIDYMGGLSDLKKRIMRSIGDPETRFAEDPVRIIRLARFCAQLDMTPSRRDLKAAKKLAHRIVDANDSRLLEEIYKIFRSGESGNIFRNLNEYGLLQYWYPELGQLKEPESCFIRLDAIDRHKKSGAEVPSNIYFTALFYDMLEEAVRKEEPSNFQETFMMLRNQFRELAIRMRMPRAEFDRMCNNVARQGMFTSDPGNPKRRKQENRFMRNQYFADAMRFFEILSEATGSHAEALQYWKNRVAEMRRTDRNVKGGSKEPRKRPGKPRNPSRNQKDSRNRPKNTGDKK